VGTSDGTSTDGGPNSDTVIARITT
jgi:hypothetical protein